MRKYLIELTGVTPLIMHQDNIGWSENLKKWQKAPENKGVSIAGDDRSPAWTWIGSLYTDAGVVAIPSDNIFTMLREGGAQVSTGKRQQTFKARTQSGISPIDAYWPIASPGRIEVAKILELTSSNDFDHHVEVVQSLGFELLVKRAAIGKSKHVRVRPFFRKWSCSGAVAVTDDQITTEVLRSILDVAGQYKGICDWRPSSKTPGHYGIFTATLEEV